VKIRRLALLGWLCLAVGCHGRTKLGGDKKAVEPATYGPETLYEVDLSRGVPESTEAGGWFPLPASRTFVGLLTALQRLQDEKKTKGVFVNLGQAQLQLTQVEELAPLLRKLRDSHIPVVCHADGLDNALLWLVTQGCDKLWLSPAGSVETIGIAAQTIYVKGLLDEFKVQADFLSLGRYKSAAEMFTRDGPSPDAHQALTELLASVRGTWLSALTGARGNAGKYAESGPFGAREAKDQGLVDSLGDAIEARRFAKKLTHAGSIKVVFGPGADSAAEHGIVEILRLLSNNDSATEGKPYIAVIPAIGGITMKSEGVFSSEGIVFESLAKTIARVTEAPEVRAVVLRIDSPGGSALASDLLWSRLRELNAKKPLVASVGSMAASGGYYLACAAETIVANRTSIVGSIGVLGGKIVFGTALEAHGVHTVTTPASPAEGAAARAAYLSPLTPWDEATRVRLRLAMNEVYDLFVQRVSEGRKTTIEHVQSIAEGRIWSGEQGKERGLVDEFGGLAKAIELAREKAGLSAEVPVKVEGPAEGFLAALGLDAQASAVDFEHAIERQQKKLWSPLAMAPRGVAPWITGLTPLLSREQSLALCPVAFTIQ